ncbi:hypothetical protein Tco_0909987 [Tanacetum coccineum]|uniref:Uncharacterized protein n=1 Tax=Tanacetum coccineum TaxID=301880 RepID=A0ABQ5CTB7_9ASTR
MHNNIMVAGSRDQPPMLATRRYPQWQSRILRYIDTRTNGDALRKCILEGPYAPFTIIIPAVPAIDDSPKVLKRTAVETILNMSPENKEHYQSEKEAIHLLLTRIRDEIYSTNVDTSPRYKNDNQTGQFGNQRTVTDVGARETIGSQVQYDVEYNVFANERHHFEQPKSISNTCVVEKVDNNVILDSPDMCDNDIQTDQNAKECNDERAALANLTLDTEENKKAIK